MTEAYEERKAKAADNSPQDKAATGEDDRPLGATRNDRFLDTVRDVAEVTRASFPELIDYYDPEKDEIV